MNAHKPIPLAGVSVSPAGAPASFNFRTVDCICDVHEQSNCDACNGLGEVDAQCVDCSRVVALNDDGLCRRCSDSDTLPIAEFQEKYLCGWALAERSALNG